MTNSPTAPWRLLPVALVFLAALSCTPKPAPPSAEEAEDDTILAVSKAIRQHSLTTLQDACLAYQFDAPAGAEEYEVTVRENHRRPECGGDPNVSPRLFTVRVNKQTGAMTTDQGSVSGEFRALGKE